MPTFKIHPAIGFARLGNSDDFYLAPEQPGALPIQCDENGVEQRDKKGNPIRVEEFKESDDLGRVKRQAARFRVFAFTDDDGPSGTEIAVGDEYDFELETTTTGKQIVKGTVTDIQWTAHLANKKASWYEFQETDGRHGYSSSHPLRNAGVTQPDERRQLIIDPGPQTVSYAQEANRRRSFAKGGNPGYAQSFPPGDINPNPITTLGDLIASRDGDHLRLILLGGHGNSGSTATPVITDYANNDGWFDDISDGPVSAKIAYSYVFKYTDAKGKPKEETRQATMEVQQPAWAVVGYPRYAPQILDMITMDETLYNIFVRHFAYRPKIFGVPPFDKATNKTKDEKSLRRWRSEARYNPEYYPKFYAEIWPILERPDAFKYVLDFDYFEGGDPHNTGTGGNFDQKALSTPPLHGDDPHRKKRRFIYGVLRKAGGENHYNIAFPHDPTYLPRAMPELCGNNPLSNTAADKFLRLTDTQLFLLKQWADGKFVNECLEWGEDEANCTDPWAEPPTTGTGIDRGVLANILGGAFCPGGELGWIVLNPAIYSSAYRIHHATYQAGALSLPAVIADSDGSPAADLAAGLEPGDMTKYIGIPWQADFHECTYQNINLTYDEWNNIELDSTGDPAGQKVAYNVAWWPAHRPLVVPAAGGGQVYWASGIPDNNVGDLRMVEAWKDVGFLKETNGGFAQVERNDAALGPPVRPGQRVLGGGPSKRRAKK